MFRASAVGDQLSTSADNGVPPTASILIRVQRRECACSDSGDNKGPSPEQPVQLSPAQWYDCNDYIERMAL